jgi:hypothetical protein
MSTQQNKQTINKLEYELVKLKNKLQMAYELKAKWLPNGDRKKCGEVIGKTIFIYEDDEDKALDTLKHEFLDYVISNATEVHYKKIINLFIKLFEEEMYERKEKLIEKLLKVLD